jgi:chromatin segregation and condensation protein Rec8/ScpA/Scc1 (kleisin family)
MNLDPAMEAYEADLGKPYNGPLDLLYSLLREREMPPEKIAIAEIADQYMAWIQDPAHIDLEAAGEFLILAAKLMELKLRELLPREAQTPEELALLEGDREGLIAEVLAYQRFMQKLHECTDDLRAMEEANFGTFGRGVVEKNDEERLVQSEIWNLVHAFAGSLQSKRAHSLGHNIGVDKIKFEDRQQDIRGYMKSHGRALFDDLLGRDRVPMMAAVSFQAIMEDTKDGFYVFRQSESFGALWIYRKDDNTEYAQEMAFEQIFYTEDPDLKPGLLDFVLGKAAAAEAAENTSLHAVLRKAVGAIEAGAAMTEETLQEILDGSPCQ